MEIPGWLVTAALCALLLVLLSPYLLLIYLRVKLRKYRFQYHIYGLFSLTDLHFQTPDTHIQVYIRTLCLRYSRGKVVLRIQGIEIDLTESVPTDEISHFRPTKGGLLTLLIRLLLLLILQYIELRVSVLSLYLPAFACFSDGFRLSLGVNHTVSSI